MRIYLTHCSAKKDDSLRDSSTEVPPDVLYAGQRIQAFMRKCRQRGVIWAIFSDKYGIWFPSVSHGWYEKHPGKVTEEEFAELLRDFDFTLQDYDEIRFYYHPARFHPLYEKLLSQSSLTDRMKRFTHVECIE